MLYIIVFNYSFPVEWACSVEAEKGGQKWDYLSETENFLEFLGLFETTILKCGKIHNAQIYINM